MTTNEQKPIHAKPNLYSYYFLMLKEIAVEYGYNLVVHGSMRRDLDLIAIPWKNELKDEFLMIQEFERKLSGRSSDDKRHYLFNILPGNRNNYVINLNRGTGADDPQYYIDISVLQTIQQTSPLQSEIDRLKSELEKAEQVIEFYKARNWPMIHEYERSLNE